jgi:hypothetical protein
MQRCPYIHEMKERLLGSQPRGDSLAMESFGDRERDKLLGDSSSSRPGSNQVKTVPTVATVVKVRLGSIETAQKIQVISIFLSLIIFQVLNLLYLSTKVFSFLLMN